jgi:hypothetical protein
MPAACMQKYLPWIHPVLMISSRRMFSRDIRDHRWQVSEFWPDYQAVDYNPVTNNLRAGY